MILAPRSIDDMVDAYRATVAEPVREFEPHANVVATSFSHQDLSDLEQGEATYSLHRLGDAPHRTDDAVLSHPQALAEFFKSFPEVGIWNASGDAQWQAGEGWMVVKAKLVHEDDIHAENIVFVTLGIRQTTDGWAALVWGPGHDSFAQVFGFDGWPEEGWEFAVIDYGE